jgi:hypothetical protein
VSTPRPASKHGFDQQQEPQILRILPPISGRLIRSHGPRPHSAKTYGNLVLETACRKTDEFPVPATTAVIGPLMAFPKNC